MMRAAMLPDTRSAPAVAEPLAAVLHGAIPALALRDGPVELLLCDYAPGDRAGRNARARQRAAVATRTRGPPPGGPAYEAETAADLAGDVACLPQLVACEPELELLIFGWLEPLAVGRPVGRGRARGAGRLAARRLRRRSALRPVMLGLPIEPARILDEAGHWVAAVRAVDPELGMVSTALTRLLSFAEPKEGGRRLVPGTLYDRRASTPLDRSGAVDWRRSEQQPVELGSSVFLATIARLLLLQGTAAGDAVRSDDVLPAGIVDERARLWHWAAVLLHLAARQCRPASRERGDWRARTHALLSEAARLAEAAE